MMNNLRSSFVIFLLLTILTGVAYPLVVTLAAQILMPVQANGSIMTVNGVTVGSELIGQQFDAPRYFWGRPSAAGYNASASAGSNLGPNNPALLDAVKARIAELKSADPTNTAPIPADLVTASGSGLDPHISVEAAYYQVARVARARAFAESSVRTIVDRFIEPPQFYIFGEARVNVLKLNLALDQLK